MRFLPVMALISIDEVEEPVDQQVCVTRSSVQRRLSTPLLARSNDLKTRSNAENLAVMNVASLLGEIENLPLTALSIDLVISNGVFNLCRDKSRVLAEVFRVLKPGGRLQMADILLEPHVTTAEVATKGSWSD
jgi:SAM-dependent methyltransferase